MAKKKGVQSTEQRKIHIKKTSSPRNHSMFEVPQNAYIFQEGIRTMIPSKLKPMARQFHVPTIKHIQRYTFRRVKGSQEQNEMRYRPRMCVKLFLLDRSGFWFVVGYMYTEVRYSGRVEPRVVRLVI